MQVIDVHERLLVHHGERLLWHVVAWSLNTLEGPPSSVVDAGQEPGTHVSFQ
jgi:hypothetical protein